MLYKRLIFNVNYMRVNEICTYNVTSKKNKKFELMLTIRAKAYSSSGSVVQLKMGVFTLS